MIDVKLTENLNIVATLFDGDQTKFLRARVVDGANTEVSGSPFTLTHNSNGTYINSTYTPLVIGIFIATVEVFDDAGFATINLDYQKGEESYAVSEGAAKVDEILTEIENTTNALTDVIDNNDGRAF